MLYYSAKLKKGKQYLISIIVTLLMSMVCYLITDYIGYRSVALILLFTVSVLSVILSVFPVLVSAILSALIWDYFFIPPFFNFHISNTEDLLMLSMYFVIALLNGITTSQIRHSEAQSRIRDEKLNALKLYNTLFNSISHELRTPVTTIMGVSETLISNNKQLSEDDKQTLNKEVFIASERLNRLIENLLNMSRLESGFLKIKKDWCDCEELIYTAINRLKPEIDHYNMELSFQSNLPYVKLDFGLIEQAIYNVLHNICVHTPERTKINISVSVIDENLNISISDNGPGFNKQHGEMVKTSSDRSKGGLGLGLSIVKGFVNAHDGEVVTQDNKDGGASLFITIPVETTKIEPENE